MADLLPGEGTIEAVISGAARWCVVAGDALDVLRAMPDASIDAVVTDPPAGIAFMGKAWDHHKGGRAAWVAWLTEIMAEALRVLKPGGHALVWALPRTSHWTATALEDAGFEIRDRVAFVFGSGFPKSLDVGKALDQAAGAERETISEWRTGKAGTLGGKAALGGLAGPDVRIVSTPATVEWDGWGTALKPAVEDWWLCRKPLDKGLSVAANVTKWGVGALNVAACRVGNDAISQHGRSGYGHWFTSAEPRGREWTGRWPPNICHDGSAEVVECFPMTAEGVHPASRNTSGYSGGLDQGATGHGTIKTDAGNAARFFPALGPDADDLADARRIFYGGKATRADRNEGLSGAEERPILWSSGEQSPGTFQSDGTHRAARNPHPTVKSTPLMRWLCRLITPPDGIVLDFFAGSGSTGKGALKEGFRVVLVEGDKDCATIARRRCADAALQPRLIPDAPQPPRPVTLPLELA